MQKLNKWRWFAARLCLALLAVSVLTVGCKENEPTTTTTETTPATP